LSQKEHDIEEVASEIINISRTKIIVNLRFLDTSISKLEPISIFSDKIGDGELRERLKDSGEVETITYLTDGRHLIYNPIRVIQTNIKTPQVATRTLMHILYHCIFHHMYNAVNMNRNVWDLACDIAVENIINECNLTETVTPMQLPRIDAINKLRNATDKDGNPLIKKFTAEWLYDYFINDSEMTDKQLASLRGLFYADNHEMWYMTEDQLADFIGQSKESGDGEYFGLSAEDYDEWKKIADMMGVDLESFSKNFGDTAGSLVENLKEVNRKKNDYASFLRRFAVMNEAMKINDDEFDYIYYSYGLQLYKKIPLIEPLEYKDIKQIKEFVIAIDTSGSVSLELAQAFVQTTFDILKSTESFAERINLHIIQCDTEIAHHAVITDQEEFDAYIREMKIYGRGGTDFRPAFRLVDELIENKEFSNLKGIIYFTDGYGVFPEKAPGYDAAFIMFRDGNYDTPDVPSWAIKIELDKEDIIK